MNLRLKFYMLALSTGLVALGLGTCVSRLLGDLAADSIWLRAID